MLSHAAPPKRKHNLALSKRDLCAALRLLMILFSPVSLCPSIENFVTFWCQGLKNLELSGLINLGDVEVLNILYHGENQECHIDLIACMKNIEVVKLCSPCLTKRACKDPYLIPKSLPLRFGVVCLDEFKSRTWKSPFKDRWKAPLILRMHSRSNMQPLKLSIWDFWAHLKLLQDFSQHKSSVLLFSKKILALYDMIACFLEDWYAQTCFAGIKNLKLRVNRSGCKDVVLAGKRYDCWWMACLEY